MRVVFLRLFILISMTSILLGADPKDGVEELSHGVAKFSVSQPRSQVPPLMDLAAAAVVPLLIYECKTQDGLNKALAFVDTYLSGDGVAHLKELVCKKLAVECDLASSFMRGQPVVFEGRSDDSCSVQFSPDGTSILCAFSRELMLLTLADWACTLLPINVDANIEAFAISPDGQYLALGFSNSHCGLFDLQQNVFLFLNPVKIQDYSGQLHDNNVTSIAFSPTGRLIVYGTKRGTVTLLDRQNNRCISCGCHYFNRLISFVGVAADEHSVFSGSLDGIIIHRFAHEHANSSYITPLPYANKPVCGALSGAGCYLAVGHNAGLVGLRDNDKQEWITQFTDAYSSPLAVSFSSDEKLLAFCTKAGAVVIIDLQTRRSVMREEFVGVSKIVFSPVDNNLIVLHKKMDGAGTLVWAITFLVPLPLEELLYRIAGSVEPVASSVSEESEPSQVVPVLEATGIEG